MLLFIERNQYELSHTVRDNLTVRDILKGIVSIPIKEKSYTPKYVGYCYNKEVDDVVFFLPKVVLTGKEDDEENNSTIFDVNPQELIDFNSIKENNDYKEFLSTLSIWVYRALNVYNNLHNDKILESQKYQSVSNGQKTKCNTLFDVIIALRDFNKNNQDYFTFIAKTVHSGFNKIHWQKTINHTTPYFCKGKPIYANPINRKKKINFDEELLIIYFSILNYIEKSYGFSFDINLNYELISLKKLKEVYINQNYGCYRLNQIKYKYFADKALLIWNLCYAFFDREHDIAINKQNKDVLLAKDFEHIFEKIIDHLIVGDDNVIVDDKKINNELTQQRDGKIVDHLFTDTSLFDDKSKTYYIADSKYYKRSKEGTVSLDKTSVYKQFTYAKNIIQLNIEHNILQLRDPLTEGYNPIPNFFISAIIPTQGEKSLSFEDEQIRVQDRKIYFMQQYDNRFFDRDTLLLCHFDVNFLFILSLFGENNAQRQVEWRTEVRKEFKEQIRDTIFSLYTFYSLTPHNDTNVEEFINEHFKLLNGKIYRVNENEFILALIDTNKCNKWKEIKNFKDIEKNINFEDIKKKNEDIIEKLKSAFEFEPKA